MTKLPNTALVRNGPNRPMVSQMQLRLMYGWMILMQVPVTAPPITPIMKAIPMLLRMGATAATRIGPPIPPTITSLKPTLPLPNSTDIAQVPTIEPTIQNHTLNTAILCPFPSYPIQFVEAKGKVAIIKPPPINDSSMDARFIQFLEILGVTFCLVIVKVQTVPKVAENRQRNVPPYPSNTNGLPLLMLMQMLRQQFMLKKNSNISSILSSCPRLFRPIQAVWMMRMPIQDRRASWSPDTLISKTGPWCLSQNQQMGEVVGRESVSSNPLTKALNQNLLRRGLSRTEIERVMSEVVIPSQVA